ncbi:LruC domain-containing protein [Bacteroides sp. 51]|uniref:LruC domain-containing protein n=1 Tax=Bacteroides sp. 51 TaxID=2302938 RepID=UPI0013D0D53A|nr:LruC domain-containing protein [Bacteroides sp. 51]NDV81431.1 LruC domain-containing protein [Bacteroides sp. 51]
MKKGIISQICAASIASMFFVFAACQDKDYYEPIPEPIDSDEPSLLDYSTSKDVKLSATYDVQKGVISIFDVYTTDPLTRNADGTYNLKSNLEPIAGGICVDGKINLTKVIPASVTELYLYSPSLFVPRLMYARIEAGMANFSVVDLNTAIRTGKTVTRTLGDGEIDGYLSQTGVSSSPDINEQTYRPNYIVDTKEVPSKYLNRITSAFPDGTAVTNPDYYKDAVLYLHESAELKLAMVHGDAANNNALSYFFYEGTPADISTVDQSKIREIVALPYAKLNKGLNAGDMVQLMYYDNEAGEYVKEFPKGVTVGFILRSNAFYLDDEGKPGVSTETDAFYSIKSLNSDNFQHTIFFDAALASEDDSFYCFGFEDQKYGGDKDCNDVMFYIDVNPATAIEEPEPLPEVGYVTYTQKAKGFLAFEDSWPYKRDYDLNDVVVNYSSKTTFRQKTEDGVPVTDVLLQTIEDKITLVHSGGDFTSGFAYKVNINPSLVEKITIDDVPYTRVSDGNGFIIKICDNVAHEVQVNKPSAHVYISTPKTFDVKIVFKEENSVNQDYFSNNKLGAPYNPYIIPINEYGKVEVHLPFYPPTDGANITHLFGTVDDKSIPGDKIWYVGSTDNPYPFAVHLFNADYFKLPVEAKTIDYTYPRFTDWVESKFAEWQNWFEYPADVD